MYSKITLQNIKKSYKDYTIYFLTLILAVCIFYSFNSIDSQKALTDIKSSGGNYLSKLMDIMSAVSVFVSIILGSLILYANNFLIKKRKKELGIYMILGMGKRKISKILVKNDKIIEENLSNYMFTNNFFTIIIRDEFLSDYNKIHSSILNVMYLDENREENNKKYNEINENRIAGKYKDLSISYMEAFSKDEIYSGTTRATTSILFVGIYLGLVFLITSMAVLALQQLLEASDSIERYKSLKRIGVNKEMIDKTIFHQTLIYFTFPMILALIHSVIGIKVVNDYISMFSKAGIKSSALITALIFSVIYVGYFYTTYTGYKNIVRSNI
ncbi:hypothetical protein FDF31_04045 [Clostridium sporogenes]|nr:hypothetical protein [Clostridium sporogenes]NFS24841.1 hypothetical protein [Clostridium sporogenes]